MEKHITLVGVLNIAYRAWTSLAGMFLVGLGLGFNTIVYWLRRENIIRSHEFHEIPDFVFDLAPVILIVIGGLVLTVSAAGIIGGIGVLRRHEWGRLLLLVVSFFTLLRIPLGTLLGGYSIWALMNDELIRLFTNPPGASSAPK